MHSFFLQGIPQSAFCNALRHFIVVPPFTVKWVIFIIWRHRPLPYAVCLSVCVHLFMCVSVCAHFPPIFISYEGACIFADVYIFCISFNFLLQISASDLDNVGRERFHFWQFVCLYKILNFIHHACVYLCACVCVLRACAVFVFHTLKICLFKTELQKTSEKFIIIIRKLNLYPTPAHSLAVLSLFSLFPCLLLCLSLFMQFT